MSDMIVLTKKDMGEIKKARKKIWKTGVGICPNCGKDRDTIKHISRPFIEEGHANISKERETFGKIHSVVSKCRNCGSIAISHPFWMPNEFPTSKEEAAKLLWLSQCINDESINPNRFVYNRSTDFNHLKGGADWEDFYNIRMLGYGILIQFQDIPSDVFEDTIMKLRKNYYVTPFEEDHAIYLYGCKELLSKGIENIPRISNTLWSAKLLYTERVNYSEEHDKLEFEEASEFVHMIRCERHQFNEGKLINSFLVMFDDKNKLENIPDPSIYGETVEIEYWLKARITEDIKNDFGEVL